MADKDLKRLSRTELLELLLQQTRERERLEQKLEEVQRQLADRQIRLEKAASNPYLPYLSSEMPVPRRAKP